MSEIPTYIGFEEYSERVPQNIPLAVQQPTSRFVGGRAARVAELPQWEQLRQTGSDIRQYTIENMDVCTTMPDLHVEIFLQIMALVFGLWFIEKTFRG